MTAPRMTLVVAVALLVGRAADAQTVVYSGAGANASIGGGGSRPVWQIGSRYFVFFDNGSEVVYATSPDGTAFTAPASASGSKADLGFSVARKNATTLGLVWGGTSAAGYTLSYREATVSGATLTFGAVTVLATDPTNERGFLPTLTYSSVGSPIVADIEYNRSYVPGSENGGCGATQRWRLVTYWFDGTMWPWQTYCNDFQTAQSPASTSIALSGANVIASAIVTTELTSKIVHEGTELAEPWNLTAAARALDGQLSTVQSKTLATDVHYVYSPTATTVGYARQDGTMLSLSANVLDVTSVGTGTYPVLTRPDVATGCYTIAFVSGNSIVRRRFSGTIASLAAQTTAFTAASAPTNLSAELESGGTPAMLWQVGSTIYFGIPADAPPPTIAATPTSAPADGMTDVAIDGGVLRDSCGTPVAAGAPVTVATTTGAIVDVDVDAATPGTQIAAGAGGTVAFTVRAPGTAGIALVSAHLAAGGETATVSVPFGDVVVGCNGMPVGSSCITPGDLCTTGTCDSSGACVASGPRDCNDQMDCTVDSCDPVAGCMNMAMNCGANWDQLGVRGGGCACNAGDAGATAVLQLCVLGLLVRRRRRITSA